MKYSTKVKWQIFFGSVLAIFVGTTFMAIGEDLDGLAATIPYAVGIPLFVLGSGVLTIFLAVLLWAWSKGQ